MRRVVVLADQPAAAERARLALRAAHDLDVVGRLPCAQSVRASIGLLRPDVVLVDDAGDPGDAVARIRECRDQLRGATILLLSDRMDEASVRRALAAGTDACVCRSAAGSGLGTLIREVADRNVVSALPTASRELTLAGKEELTPREREILTLAADGLTNARIAGHLWVTEQTVKFHLSNAYRKLGVTNRTEASRYVHVPGFAKRLGPRLVPTPPAL
jgi:DNA-binding NarL/FixJ family response regulator